MSPKIKYDIVPVAEVPTDDATSSPRLPVVLVVDDERVIADTLSIILGKSGFKTMTAYDEPRLSNSPAQLHRISSSPTSSCLE